MKKFDKETMKRFLPDNFLEFMLGIFMLGVSALMTMGGCILLHLALSH